MAIGRPLGSKNRTTQELALDLKIKKKKMELKVLEEKKKHAREAEKIAVKRAAQRTQLITYRFGEAAWLENSWALAPFAKNR